MVAAFEKAAGKPVNLILVGIFHPILELGIYQAFQKNDFISKLKHKNIENYSKLNIYFHSQLPVKEVAPRAGDLSTLYCDPGLAHQRLGWKAEFGIEQMCQDTWNWCQKNPNGFKGQK